MCGYESKSKTRESVEAVRWSRPLGRCSDSSVVQANPSQEPRQQIVTKRKKTQHNGRINLVSSCLYERKIGPTTSTTTQELYY